MKTSRTVILKCAECAEIGTKINLWSSPTSVAGGAKIRGSVAYNTSCKVLDTMGGWLRVQCGGTIGWVQTKFTQ